jgi:Schlafen group 3, DNA/RNA helicase domain
LGAYFRDSLAGFIKRDVKTLNSDLTAGHAGDGYFQLLGTQTKSWMVSLPMLRDALSEVLEAVPSASEWGVLLEYPLYRLRKRIDMVLIAQDLLFVIELKVGANEVESADVLQVEEYALDLRDFHKRSHDLRMQPVLCCTELSEAVTTSFDPNAQIQEVCAVSAKELGSQIVSKFSAHQTHLGSQLSLEEWDSSSYEPVPSIIEAATTIFAGHSVQEISRSDAQNLTDCSNEVLRLIDEAREKQLKRIIVVTGVPGAGKTLAGLNVVHHSKEGGEVDGKVIYLSGNTPLVTVIREALAQDEWLRAKQKGEKKTLKDIRHSLRSRIQHINDFLKEYCQHDLAHPPHEHAIVFDEAQRAWDEKQGKKKFDRDTSEPELLMEIMNRHQNWAAIVCLVGAGQEINSGEPGMQQWGQALRAGTQWELCAPKDALQGGAGMAGTALFPEGIPDGVKVDISNKLKLTVPLRSYRSERISDWVDAVLEGRPEEAQAISEDLDQYPVTLVRTLEECRSWLKARTRGKRRCGLLASAGASRLRAEGLGVALTVQDKNRICHWYLKPDGDYRSSNALEVTSNEYTSQGLEVDFAGVCWGGDFVRNSTESDWKYRELSGMSWNNVHMKDRRRFIKNKYRVFLTRAREGMVLFVPHGDSSDDTRIPSTFESVAAYLKSCGAKSISD